MHSMVAIANYERKYSICSSGKIWNQDKEQWSSITINPNGYCKVILSLNGKQQFLVHQLVALHFLPNPYRHTQVNHKDGNKLNNDVSNLEWVSSSENVQHSLETGLRKGYLSKAEKAALVQRVLSGELIRDLAKEIGRREESLSGMLRRYAEETDQSADWVSEMRRRRRDVAINNLRQVNP